MRKVVIGTLILVMVNIVLCAINREWEAVLGSVTAVIYIYLYLSETKNNKEVIVRDPKTGRFKKK